MSFGAEAGEFRVFIGSSSDTVNEAGFRLVAGEPVRGAAR